MVEEGPAGFSAEERAAVHRAIRERRDVRRGFLPGPLPEEQLKLLLAAAHHGPSVGLMQPWRFIVIRSEPMRREVHHLFERANMAAAIGYTGERRELYSDLKLEGLREAPQHLCVVCDTATSAGHGLGRQTMPQTTIYSAVCAIQNLWLAARAEGVGVGWVSILDPDALKQLLRVPPHAELIAYLCIGYVDAFASSPDLEQRGWERRIPLGDVLRSEHYDQPYETSEPRSPE